MSEPTPILLQGPDDRHCNDWELEFKQRAIAHLAGQSQLRLVEDPKEAEIILWFESNRFRNWRHTDLLLDSNLLRNHADKVFAVNYEANPPGFLPGFYTGLERARILPNFHSPWNYPFHSNSQVEKEEGPAPISTGKRFLFSFRGATSHPVRKSILSLLPNTPETPITHSKYWFNHPEDIKRAYVEEIRASEFVLCPRGISPSSIRLFEVMQLGSVPVIISDGWAPVEGPAWEECSVRIRESEVGGLPELLRNLRHRSKAMGLRARQEWERHFSQPNNFIQMVKRACSMRKCRNTPLDLRSLEHFWNSKAFKKANGWLLHQRLLNKIDVSIKLKRRRNLESRTQ